MSQAKVDRYKEEKKNRKNMAKEKRIRIFVFYNLPCLIWLMQSSAPESRFVT